MSRHETLRAQLDSASLVLQTMRLDMIALRSAGVQSAIDAVSSATQEARALSQLRTVRKAAGLPADVRSVGEAAGRGKTLTAELFTVADTSALWCFVQVPEKDLPSVTAGSQAAVTVSSLAGEDFPGRVDYLADMVDRATRTVRARVRVDNPDNRLKAGMFATIAVRVGSRTVLSIPETAVLAANGENFVFVEMAPGTYRKHLVRTGSKGGARVEILEGLDADEPVVVQGGFTLKSELEKGAPRGGLGGGDGHAH